MSQESLMMFDPATGVSHPFPSHAAQYRRYCGQVAWLFNPWSGERRDARDVGSDTFGHLIQPPGETFMRAAPEKFDCPVVADGKHKVVDGECTHCRNAVETTPVRYAEDFIGDPRKVVRHETK